MNLAKMTYGGRITIPREIRSALKMKTGDSLIFFLKGNGEVVVNNAALIAVEEAQNAVHGSAYSDDEILADVMELRYGRGST